MHCKMKRIIITLIVLVSFRFLQAQTIIQMVDYYGVYTIPCEVNGMKSRMIFDTGASKVSLSRSFCEILLDNDYISMSDFTGTGGMLTADGRIVDYAELLLRSVKIGEITLHDVPAVVVNSQDAPMLFGQSAIQMLGEVSIKGDKLYIYDGNNAKQSASTNSYFERWDAKQYNYSNYTYGFGWQLPSDYEWEKVEGNEKHTVFRAVSYPFVVFVNAQVSAKEKNIWSIYDQLTELAEQIDMQVEKKTGLMAYERTFEKAIILGQHAIKTTFKEYFKDSRYEEPAEDYAEEYIFIQNGYNFTVAVKVAKEAYDAMDCSKIIADIFKGFRFTVKQ